MAKRVVFRRIRGRIIPIIQNAPFVAAGGFIGATSGNVTSGLFQMRKRKKLEKAFTEDLTNSKKFLSFLKKKNKIVRDLNISLVSESSDIDKVKGLTFLEKVQIEAIVDSGGLENNAFFLQSRRGKRVILAGKKVPKNILGHEIGHAIDFSQNKPRFYEGGIFGTLSGKELKREQDAWDKSPVRSNKHRKRTQDLALSTYSEVKVGTRIGAFTGAVTAGGLIALRNLR